MRRFSPAQAGNAILAAVIVMAVAMSAIVITADTGLSVRRQVTRVSMESRVLAALDAVLARRQQEVIYKSSNEQPEQFVTWNKNYGVDFIGDIEVRWKIEPATGRRVDSDGEESLAGNPLPSDAPLPGEAGGAPETTVENRGRFYLYRIAAEARFDSNLSSNSANAALDRVDSNVTADDNLVRAQGVRFVVTPNESSLNFLLYYAQQGPKADLELSHGWPMNLVGDIYTGGAAYFGSGTQVNNWAALRQTPAASNAYSDTDTLSWTVVGPPNPLPASWTTWATATNYTVGARVQVGDSRYQCKAAHTSTGVLSPASGNAPGTAAGRVFWHDVTNCRVIAVDGVFRLSKQVLYSAVNGYPMSGSAPSGFSLDAAYSLSATVFPGEKAGNPASASYRLPDSTATTVFNGTWLGTIINPMRAGDLFATVATDSSKDYMRQIMGVPLRGVDGSTPATMIGNDSRDRTRTSASSFVWKSGSVASTAPGFNKLVRTRENGAAAEELAERFRGRPDEAQALETPTPDLDNDPTTDEHEYAQPLFLQSTGSTGPSYAGRRTTASLDAIEVPGSYLSKALGAGRYMGRKTDYTGWKIVDASGNAATGFGNMGLIIRERPIPDSSYFVPTAKPGTNDPAYMPYAYGKIRSSAYPFTTVTVSGNSSNTTTGAVWTSTTTSPNVFRNIDTSIRSKELYEGNGSLYIASAMAPGSGKDAGTDFSASGWNDSSSGYYRFPQYFQDHWRFVHLRRPGKGTSTPQGLTAYYFKDKVGGVMTGPLGGRLMLTRTDANIDFAFGSSYPAGVSSVGTDDYSIRWMGWIKAPTSDTYTLSAYSDDGMRVWVDGKLVIHEWADQGTAERTGTFAFSADEWYPIVVDYYERSGDASCVLKWRTGTNTLVAIPATQFTPATDATFDWTTFTAVQGRISSASGLDGSKVGLMLRPTGGVSPIMDGRDPYIALTYAAKRGIVAQVRGERSRSPTGTAPGYFVGTATLASPSASTSSLGEIPGDPTSATTSAVTRSGKLIIQPQAVRIYRYPGETSALTVYTPGSSGAGTHPYSGVTGATETAWPAGSGTNADWSTVKAAFTQQSDQTISQGTIKGIRVGKVTLRQQKWPRARSRARMLANWNWRLTKVDDPVLQRFRWVPGDAVPTAWSGMPNDASRYLVTFADPTGNRIFRTFTNTENTWTPSSQAISTRYLYQLNNGLTIDNGGTDAGGRLSRELDGGDLGTSSSYQYWFPDTDANGISDVSQPDGSATIGSTTYPKYYLYTSSSHGMGLTKPGIYNGSAWLRDATEAEVVEALTQLYPTTSNSDWKPLYDANVAYPTTTPTSVSYRTGVPTDTFQPAVPHEVPAVMRLATAITSAATTLTLNHVRMLTTDEILILHSTAGSERVRVTAVTPASNQITVSRGSTSYAHPATTLVSVMPFPISALKTTITAATSTLPLWTVPTANPLGILVGDVLTIMENTNNNSQSLTGGATTRAEQVRVTSTANAASGTIDVTRGVNGTTALAWTVSAGQAFSAVDTSLDSNSNAVEYRSPPAVFLGGNVRGVITSTGGTTSTTATSSTLTLADVANVAVDDVLMSGTEVLQVTAVNATAKQITVDRGVGFSTKSAIPGGLPLLSLPVRTFAVNRDRTVPFDVNSFMTPGATPKTGGGWYWTHQPLYRPWKASWTSITPLGRTGGFQPRLWGASQLTPDSTLPTVETPSNCDAQVPTDTLAPATGLRWRDDQPALYSSSTSYVVGDVVMYNNQLYRCDKNATTLVPSSTDWSLASVWLRIERISATSTEVRFLYALATDEPIASDWRPVLTEPDTEAATTPRAGRTGTASSRELRFDLARWFGSTTLASALTSSATTMTLTSNSGAWQVGDILAIDDELVEVTAGSGTSLTVTRGVDSSTAAAHSVSTPVSRISYRGDSLLIGPCANANKTTSLGTIADGDFLATRLTDLRIENRKLASTNTDYDIDAADWDASDGSATTPTEDTKYLASQYQVFFGPYEITEDFFFWGQGTSNRLASEDWIYNTREFWSQSRWWDDGTERDPGYVLPTNTAYSNREIWAKTTLLTLNLRNIQDYLRNRTLGDASSHRIPGGYTVASTGSAATMRDLLPDTGLIMHVSRTNRYPWNPQLSGVNPWNPGLPNSTAGATYTTSALAAMTNASARATAFASQVGTNMDTMRTGAYNLLPSHFSSALQPWNLVTTAAPGVLMRTPPIKPQDFHHGVRLVDGSSIDWDHQATNGLADGTDKFGSSKLLLVTPNHLYLQGDFNTVAQPVLDGTVSCSKSTPVAVYGDSVTFLSNDWDDAEWQIPGLVASTTDITSGGTLTYNQGSTSAPTAAATTYACAVLTHNNPTTKHRVLLGEAAALDDNLLVLESWSGIRQTFIGSIVVMDTRRYTDAYRLDGNKEAGLTPFGFIASATQWAAWQPLFEDAFGVQSRYGSSFVVDQGKIYSGSGSTDGARWGGTIKMICGIPNRELFYNPDFRTKEGTPPEMPFGIKSVGVGGWARVLP